jgi:hypothetical protein
MVIHTKKKVTKSRAWGDVAVAPVLEPLGLGLGVGLWGDGDDDCMVQVKE